MTGSAITLTAMVAYLLLPSLVPAGAAFLVAQAALVLVPAVWIAATRRPRPLAAIGLRGARPRYFAAAAAIGATAWYVNASLVALLPLPPQHAKALEALVAQPPLAYAVVAFALVPALCEEVAFRGVLARSLGRHLTVLAAAATSALVFALYHHSLVQTVPTFSIGLLLAVVAIRADSAAPTILGHALNNAIVVLLSRGELPGLSDALGAHPILALVGCAAVTAGGVIVSARG